MKKMNAIDWIAFVLVIVGGLNWGLVGILKYNLVTALLGTGRAADVVYGLIGLSAVYMLVRAIMSAGKK